jgi:hypothetical protein
MSIIHVNQIVSQINNDSIMREMTLVLRKKEVKE